MALNPGERAHFELWKVVGFSSSNENEHWEKIDSPNILLARTEVQAVGIFEDAVKECVKTVRSGERYRLFLTYATVYHNRNVDEAWIGY